MLYTSNFPPKDVQMFRRVSRSGVVAFKVVCWGRWCTGTRPSAEDIVREWPKSNEIAARHEGSVERIKKEPLVLIEEVPPTAGGQSDVELLMTSWSEEHSRQWAIMQFWLRCGICLSCMFVAFVFYKTNIDIERAVRGVAKMPDNLRVGCVVYLDLNVNGSSAGRLVIGLLTEQCPLYCEYFHRMCTGSGGKGDSFRGLRLGALVPKSVLIFIVETQEHGMEGFDAKNLPNEYIPEQGAWRGAVSSIASGSHTESPNFAVHMSTTDPSPQIFGIVLSGYDILEQISGAGVSHGHPKQSVFVEDCGELCTLDKACIVPIPAKVFESVSNGYDVEKFGEAAGAELLLWPPPSEKNVNAQAKWRFW